MLQAIIGQPLLAYLYLLLTTYPRLAGAIALFVLVVLGAVIIRAFSHTRRRRQGRCYNMAVPNGFSESSLPAGTVKTPTSSTTPATAPVPAPVAPITPVLVPVTRTSSSSTASSDLLLPLPVNTNTNINSNTNINRRTASWPPLAPIPWRSSWGFLEEDDVVQVDLEEEDTPIEQGHGHGQGQAKEHTCDQQETARLNIDINGDRINTDYNNDNDNNFLELPTAGARRTGSMEARKGSACTISGLEDIHGLQRLELGISAPENVDGKDDADADAGSPADLVGVGGQFQL
ncbi:hypothetical protein V8F20_012329 [Naviculisporaceae sp. PSN 640]